MLGQHIEYVSASCQRPLLGGWEFKAKDQEQLLILHFAGKGELFWSEIQDF